MRISSARIDIEEGRVDNSILKDYAESNTAANSSTSYTVDISTANCFKITMTGNCTFTFSNPSASGTFCSFTLLLKQDTTGSRTATWPSTVVWAGGTAPTLTTNVGLTDALHFFTVTGGGQWAGELIARRFSS